MKNISKGFIFALIFLFVCVLGFLGYQMSKKTSEIKVYVENGEISPDFSVDVTQYKVYVDSDETILKCSFEAEGCYDKIILNNGVAEKEINYNGKVYIFNIIKNVPKVDEDLSDGTKPESDGTELKISNVKGVPLNWSKEATITIEASNYNNKESLQYSLDGGNTWQKENSIVVKESQVLSAQVKEGTEISELEFIDVKKVDSTKPVVKITTTKNENGEVVLSISGGDEVSAITSVVWNGEIKDKTMKITKSGTYKVQAQDAAGNIGEDTVEIEDIDNIETERIVTFFPNGANGEVQVEKCTSPSSNGKCDVKAPKITREGYEILGWSNNADDKTGKYKYNDTITADGYSNNVYYAITKKKLSLNFRIQDSRRAKITSGNSSFTCDVFNRNTGCYVVVSRNFPTATGQNGYSFRRWDKDKNSKKDAVSPIYKDADGTETLTYLVDNVDYYDITSTSLYMTFSSNDYNGDRVSRIKLYNSDNTQVSTVRESCAIWNNEKTCTIQKPAYPRSNDKNRDYIVLSDSAYSVKGWGSYDYKNEEYKVAIDPKGSDITLDVSKLSKTDNGYSAGTYMIIIYKRSPYEATFKINNYAGLAGSHNEIRSQIGENPKKCYLYNNQTSCTVDNPVLKAYDPGTNDYKYEFVGWNTNENAHNSSVNMSNEKITINQSATYYVIKRKIITNTFIPGDTKAFKYGDFKYTKECSIYNEFDANSTCQTDVSGIPDLNENYKYIGWTNTKGSTTKTIQGNKAPELAKNQTYYSITYVNRKIQFNIPKSDYSSYLSIVHNGTKRSNPYTFECTEYYSSGKCEITVPEIKSSKSSIKVSGWGNSQNASSASISSSSFNQKINISLDKYINYSKNYYALAYDDTKSYNITYDMSSVKGKAHISVAEKQDCKMYNGEDYCNITLPNIIIDDARYSVVNWKSNTGETYKPNATCKITKDTTFTPILKYEPQKVTITFEMNDSKALQDGRTAASSYTCEIGANGYCDKEYTLPTTIPIKSGYEFVGWSDSKNATTPSINKGNSIKISKTIPTKYYAITRKKVEIKYIVSSTSIAEVTLSDPNKYEFKNSVATYYLYNGKNVSATIANLKGINGNTAIGWSKTNNSHTSDTKPNSTLTLTSSSSSEIKYYSVTSRFSSNKVKFVIDDSLKSYVTSSYNELNCAIYNNESTCSLPAPTLSLTQGGKTAGYTIIGWNTNKSATTSLVDSSGNLTINNTTGNATFYAILKKPAVTITINYQLLDQSAFNTSSMPGSMLMPKSGTANSDGNISVTPPNLSSYIKTGYEFLGWSTGNTSTSAEYKGGSSYNFSKSTTLYAITRKKTTTLTFKIQDKNAVTQSSDTSVICYLYNGSDSCKIKLPALTAKSGYKADGWAYAKSATAAKSVTTTAGGPGSTISYVPSSSNSSVTYYSVTRNLTPITLTFSIQDTKAATKSKNGTTTCYRYNGASDCNIVAPTLTAKSGYTVVGWNTSNTATSSNFDNGASKKFSSNKTYYSITKKSTPIKINFIVTKTGASKTGGNDSCYLYNGATNCKITTPNIKMSGSNANYTPTGWNTIKGASNPTWGLGVQKTVSESDNNKTYYSIFSTSPVQLE